MRLTPRIVQLLAPWVGLIALSSAAFAFPVSDIEPNWARESIKRLVEAGVARGYPDGTFRPDQSITRAEFAQMTAQAFRLEGGPQLVFADAREHPAREELSLLVGRGALHAANDTTVAPDAPLSRGEGARALVALLELEPLELRIGRDSPLFDDVPKEHPLFHPVQVAARLGLFPPFMRGRLWPEEPLSRAEAAFMIDAALRLERQSGRLERVDTERRVLWLSGPNQIQRSFPVSDLEVFDTDTTVPWTDVTPGRELHLVVNRFGRPLVAWTEPETRYADLQATLKEVAASVLTPEQLRAALDGDWTQVSTGLRLALYKELVARGVRPWEAEALLAQDWSSVQELGIVRLSELVADYLDVSPQLVAALVSRDWTTARDYAQMEALERLLQSQLFQNTPGEQTPGDGGAVG